MGLVEAGGAAVAHNSSPVTVPWRSKVPELLVLGYHTVVRPWVPRLISGDDLLMSLDVLRSVV